MAACNARNTKGQLAPTIYREEMMSATMDTQKLANSRLTGLLFFLKGLPWQREMSHAPYQSDMSGR